MIFCFLFDSISDNFESSKVKHFNIIPKTVIMPENQSITSSEKRLSVLITGGSGLIGKHLTSSLLAEGYIVSHLSRRVIKDGKVRSFLWDPVKSSVNPEAFAGIDFIVHLAGANIGERRWTTKRKREIMESRANSAAFLFNTIRSEGTRLKGFISASATGIYGSETSRKIFFEADPPADDFLGSVCKSWEDSADLFGNAGIRTVKIRTGIVLDKSDSALSKLIMPAKFGFLVQAGSGHQYMPWIHIKDLCNIYLRAIGDSTMTGPYNAVAPQHVTHEEFIKTLAGVMRLPVFPVNVPGFVLKAALGKMSDVILCGSCVSSEKISASGYRFTYRNLKEALENIIREPKNNKS
jgi:uncharacterized protein (TIGR01777 family)